jgi:hypothetical protein
MDKYLTPLFYYFRKPELVPEKTVFFFSGVCVALGPVQ